MGSNSTPRTSRGKAIPRKSKPGVNTPKKPRKDFPLNIHKGTGYWCKKIKGHVYYFGSVADDPKGVAALEEYLTDKDDLEAGREPRARKHDELTVETMCFSFLEFKEGERDGKDISPRTYQSYLGTCKTIAKVFGRQRAVSDLIPDDFRKLRQKLAKSRGLVALKNEMTRVITVFNFADSELATAVNRGKQSFAKPRKEKIDAARHVQRRENGLRMLESHEIRLILDLLEGKEVVIGSDDETGEPVKVTGTRNLGMRAMVLLAANSGFGNTDVSSLPTQAVDVDSGWVDFPRVKNATPRRVPLWPETIAAIREWLAVRPKAKNPADAKLLFLTCRGQRWVKLNKNGTPADALGQEFAKVLRDLRLKRPGVSFYAMRHGFETIAGETTDQIAVDLVMGHSIKGMKAEYIERVADARLIAVVEHVRHWLFVDAPDDTSGPEGERAEDCNDIDQPQTVEQDDTRRTLHLFVG